MEETVFFVLAGLLIGLAIATLLSLAFVALGIPGVGGEIIVFAIAFVTLSTVPFK